MNKCAVNMHPNATNLFTTIKRFLKEVPNPVPSLLLAQIAVPKSEISFPMLQLTSFCPIPSGKILVPEKWIPFFQSENRLIPVLILLVQDPLSRTTKIKDQEK